MLRNKETILILFFRTQDLSFPWPSVRDKILAATAAGLLSAHAVCVEVWPSSDLQEQGAEPPYWVHGDDPFDPEAYELSDRFARNLGCLLDRELYKRDFGAVS